MALRQSLVLVAKGGGQENDEGNGAACMDGDAGVDEEEHVLCAATPAHSLGPQRPKSEQEQGPDGHLSQV